MRDDCTPTEIDMKTIDQQSLTGYWVHKPVRHPVCRAAATLLRWTINRFMPEDQGARRMFWTRWTA